MNTNIKQKWSELIAFLGRTSLTQPTIALEAGVSQSAVSRILASCPERNGAAFKKLCIYAEARKSKARRLSTRSIEDKALAGAISEVWNGTPEHAQALAAMIRAAGRAAKISTG